MHCTRFFLESDKRYMKERDDAFERVRLQLERAWPKRILPSPHSSSSADEKSSGVGGNTTTNAAPLETTPLRAMETNMEMVLKTLTTSSLFEEEEEKKRQQQQQQQQQQQRLVVCETTRRRSRNFSKR